MVFHSMRTTITAVLRLSVLGLCELCLLGSFLSTPLAAQPITPGGLEFVPGSTFSMPNPQSIAPGDFDNDGDNDIAIASTAQSKIVILWNGGEGVFFPPVEIAHPGPFFLETHDLNLDGYLDIICANAFSNSISIFFGTGSGFWPAQNHAVGTSPYAIVAADFNEDGIPDLAVANHQSNNVSLLRGDGFGGFEDTWGTFNYVLPTDLAVADFNLDGHLDIATTTSDDSNFSVRYGNGMGAFPVIQNYNMGIDDALFSVSAEDVTGDGRVDLIFPCPNFDQVIVYRALPAGGFLPMAPILTGDEPKETMINDFDLDGSLDVGVLNYGSGNMSLSLNDGSGNFSMVQNFESGPNPVSLRSVDLDGDDQEDLIVASQNLGTVSILLNRTLPGGLFLRGDADQDTMLTIGDPIRVLDAVFGQNPEPLLCPDAGDADDDGLLTIGDPLFLLTHLFLSGPAPAAPYSCGVDPTNDDALAPCPIDPVCL